MNKTVDESKTVNTGYVIFTPVELVEKFDNVEMRSVKDSYGNMIHTPFYKNQQVYLKLTGHSGHISEVSADSGNVYAFTQMYRLGTKSDTEKPSEQLQALLDFDARFSENVMVERVDLVRHPRPSCYVGNHRTLIIYLSGYIDHRTLFSRYTFICIHEIKLFTWSHLRCAQKGFC